MLELLSADYQPYPIYKVTRHFLIVGQGELACQSLLLQLTRSYPNFKYDLADHNLDFQAKLQQSQYHVILVIDKKPFLTIKKVANLLVNIKPKIPLILITENIDENTTYDCWQAGIVDCVESDQLFTLPRLIERSLAIEHLQKAQQASILQLQRCKKMQNIANQIITNMSDSLILSEVLQSTVDQLHDVLGVDRCLIFQADDQHQMYAKHISEATLDKQSLLGVYCDFYRFYYSQLSEGKPLVINSFASNLPPEVAEAGQICELQSLMIVPLFYNNIYLGGISFHQCRQSREWLDWEIELVKMVASHCAIAIHQAEIYATLQSELEQRQKTEIALRQSQAQILAIASNLPGIIYRLLIQPDQTISLQFVSEGVQTITGFATETIQTDFEIWRDIIYLEDQANFIKKMIEASRHSQCYSYEYRIIAADGQTKWLRDNMHFLRQGDQIIVDGVAMDITMEKQALLELKQKHNEMSVIFQAFPDLLFRVKADGTCLDHQTNSPENLLVPPAEFIGEKLQDLLPVTLGYQTIHAIGETLRTQALVSLEYSLSLPSWGEQYFEARFLPLENSEVIIISRNISDRKQIELALRESEQRFRSLIENATDLIIIIDINYNFQYISPSVQKIFGEQSSELLGSDFFANIYPDDLPMVNHALEKAIMSPVISQPPLEYRLKDNRGEWHILECVITNLLTDPTVNGIVINSYDITRQKTAEKQLLYDALHDSLTNLPNRSLFMDRLEQAIKYTERRKDYLFAVLLLDIDRFKFINESLGHQIGDQLLISITEQLVNSLRLVDTVARLGGDEFAILLENICGISDVLHIVKRIQENITKPIVLGSHEVFITASIGIVLSSTSDGVANHILRDADTAMYCAKSLGRGGYQIFCTSMHTHALNLLQLENDLRRALDSVRNSPYSISSQFRVYYQLIVSLGESKIIGFEALARWHHPERGMISPGEFIPIAEETGLIVPLGLLVLKEACHQLHEWQQLFPTDPPLSISVNLSVKQFSQSDLLQRIDEILADTKIDGRSLKLEITESALMDEHESVMNILKGLKDRNIQLCIDDFGTGYSSLSYLHRFPLNTLKIDRSFVTRMGMDNQIGDGNIDPIEIVKSIITLSHNLGIDVIAEGVETSEQMSQLQDLQCEYGQGFFFSKPIDKYEATILLQNGISHLLVKSLE